MSSSCMAVLSSLLAEVLLFATRRACFPWLMVDFTAPFCLAVSLTFSMVMISINRYWLITKTRLDTAKSYQSSNIGKKYKVSYLFSFLTSSSFFCRQPLFFMSSLTGSVIVSLVVLNLVATCGKNRPKYSTHKNSNIMSRQ